MLEYSASSLFGTVLAVLQAVLLVLLKCIEFPPLGRCGVGGGSAAGLPCGAAVSSAVLRGLCGDADPRIPSTVLAGAPQTDGWLPALSPSQELIPEL